MVSQEPIRLWMAIVFGHGLFVLAGAAMTVAHLLTLKPTIGAARSPGAREAPGRLEAVASR
jgi:hypothetical protein